MRYLVMLVVFVIAAPVVVGSLIIPLTDPAWGFDGWSFFPYVVAAGFLIALPISYVISGILMKQISGAGSARG